MYSISICINDLVAAERATIGGKEKKMYANVRVSAKKEPDQYGNDASVYFKQTEDERRAGADKIFIGDAKWFVFDGVEQPKHLAYELSLCLNDLAPYGRVHEKSGKQYVNLTVSDRKEVDKFGNDANVMISQSKEQREAGEEKVYCGNAKKVQFTAAPAATNDVKALFSLPILPATPAPASN